MTSMDPTTADTIDANDANKIAREDQDVTGAFQPISGESDGADTTGTETAETAAADGAIAGETEGAELTEDGDKQYPGD